MKQYLILCTVLLSSSWSMELKKDPTDSDVSSTISDVSCTQVSSAEIEDSAPLPSETTAYFKQTYNQASQGEYLAQLTLARWYCYGDRPEKIEKNEKKALQWCKKAMKHNKPEAEYFVALMYEKGMGVPKNMTRARKYYRKAAKKNYANAQYHLGLMYHDGLGVLINLPRAKKYYTQAAKNNHATAQNNLGFLYNQDKPTPENIQAARYWYTQAAENNHTNALYNLGCMCQNGGHEIEAFKYFHKAAQNNDAQSMYEVALCYMQEDITEYNPREALKYAHQAINQGYKPAQNLVHEIQHILHAEDSPKRK